MFIPVSLYSVHGVVLPTRVVGLFISLNLISEVLHRCAQRLACEVTPRSVKMTASPMAVALNTGHMRGHTVHLSKINFSVKEVKDLNQTNVVTPTMSSGN